MIKIKNKKSGFTLMELLVAIPMLAIVFLSMAYMLGTTGVFASTEIAKVKTQTATNNILMLIKAKGYKGLANIIPELQTVKNNQSAKIDKIALSKDSVAHPDKTTNLIVSLEEKDANPADTTNISSKIVIITVEAPDFNGISTTIKTVSF